MYNDDDFGQYPRSWGRRPVYMRIKASTFIWMGVGDLIAIVFVGMILLGV